MLGGRASYGALLLALMAVAVQAQDAEGISAEEEQLLSEEAALLERIEQLEDAHLHGKRGEKRDLDGSMPGVLRFGKRAQSFIRFGRSEMTKKEMPGVLRFGKRSMPGVLRFGKRDMPGVLRFGKRDMPGVLRFGKRSVPGVLRFGKRSDMPGVLRFGKRDV